MSNFPGYDVPKAWDGEKYVITPDNPDAELNTPGMKFLGVSGTFALFSIPIALGWFLVHIFMVVSQPTFCKLWQMDITDQFFSFLCWH